MKRIFLNSFYDETPDKSDNIDIRRLKWT